MITRLFLVELKIGISKSLETGRDERTSQRDKTFVLRVGDSCPVICQVRFPACLPSSVLNFLKTKAPSLPPIQSNARAAGMTVCVEDRRHIGQRCREPTLGVRITAQVRGSSEGEKLARWTSRGNGRCRRSEA